MELSLYDVIVGPVISNKAYRLHQTLKQIVFHVHAKANKPMVCEAVSKLFNVEVDSVRIVVRKGKRKISRTRNESVDSTKKIAIVSLKKNFDINLFGTVAQTNTQGVPEKQFDASVDNVQVKG
ncbi:50S ribosomal protein L23 [Candidatus Dependentiae bacterium]|nr:50S ribosomal protein L23 [Candidatus Dependentiae bacterium]